jgi:hypothetical protein
VGRAPHVPLRRALRTSDQGPARLALSDGKKSAIKAKARETKGEAQQMRDAYLGDDADGWTASSS